MLYEGSECDRGRDHRLLGHNKGLRSAVDVGEEGDLMPKEKIITRKSRASKTAAAAKRRKRRSPNEINDAFLQRIRAKKRTILAFYL